MEDYTVKTTSGRMIEDPPLARFLFSDTRAAPLWAVIRILIGITWLTSGFPKLSNPAWMETGEAVRRYWENAVAIPESGRPLIALDWYRGFIQGLLDSNAYVWFAKVVAVSEVLIGVALILGAFTGIAAFGGALMNWNFLMAGSTSTNPLLLIGAIGLVLAWKVAGYYGLDYFLLRWLGTPWRARGESHDPLSPAKTRPSRIPREPA